MLKILDIEPARVMNAEGRVYPSPSAIMTEDELNARMNGKLTKWFSGSPVTSSSVTVPTTEFIGRTEDLSTYDIIYMGLDISNFNTRIDASGKEYTVYNDSNMDVLIYSNIGDLTY